MFRPDSPAPLAAPRVSRGAIAVFVAALVTGALTFACGGDSGSARVTPGPPLTLEEYFRQVEGAFFRMESDLSSDPEAPIPAGRGRSTLVDAMRASLDQVESSTEMFRDDLKALTPPAEASQAHQSLVDAVERDLYSIQQARKEADETEDLDALTETLKSAGSTSAEFQARCDDLQAIADGNKVDVKLPCRE